MPTSAASDAGSGAAKTYRIVAGAADAGQRLDRLLAARLPAVSRSRIKALIVAGCVTLAGATVKDPDHRVKDGQTFAIIVPEAAPTQIPAQAIPLDIVYEDAHLIVLNKPAGLVVHPAPGNPDRTLVNALIAHCGPSLLGIGGVRRPGIVHRLDKDTSGLLVAAKTAAAHAELSRQFAAREIEREYVAVVWGVPEPSAGEIAGNIGRSPRNRKKMAVLRRGGRAAVTRYRVQRVLAGGAASVVVCRLLSGRTHQIRVHFSSKGHPLLGDPVYGRAMIRRAKNLAEGVRQALPPMRRQALHAQSLGFRHPEDGGWLKFSADLPTDLKVLIKRLE